MRRKKNNNWEETSQHVKKPSAYDPSWKSHLVSAVMTAVWSLIGAWQLSCNLAHPCMFPINSSDLLFLFFLFFPISSLFFLVLSPSLFTTSYVDSFLVLISLLFRFVPSFIYKWCFHSFLPDCFLVTNIIDLLLSYRHYFTFNHIGHNSNVISMNIRSENITPHTNRKAIKFSESSGCARVISP